MFLVHHFIRRQGLAPALRAAQLWMLDPERDPVDGMPPHLAAASRDAGLCDPQAWAGFTHLGR